MMIKHLFLVISILFTVKGMNAQEQSLLELLEADDEKVTDYTIATFKGTRLINGHSVENPAQGVLQFMIQHRFGRINGGAYELFGLDNATIRLGFDYGLTDRLAVGIGRSSFEKVYDGYLKYKLLRQSSGARYMPVSVSLVSGIAAKSIKWQEPDRQNLFSSRLYYHHQILIAQKVSDKFSYQISPTLVHRNLVETTEDKNDVFALGVGGRYKLTRSLSFNAEYFYLLPNQVRSPIYGERVSNTFSIGIDIETGGHVFQLHLTNSRGMVENHFITETSGRWDRGDIHFGFNVSRVFTVAKNKKR
jgi:hypothetical protein